MAIYKHTFNLECNELPNDPKTFELKVNGKVLMSHFNVDKIADSKLEGDALKKVLEIKPSNKL